MNDLKFAVRQLLKNPGFTAVAVLTLALGIGANTAIFSIVNTVLLNPIPGPHSDRLIQIAERDYVKGGFREENSKPHFGGVSPPVLEALLENQQLFEIFTWVDSAQLQRKTEDFTETVFGGRVPPNFFATLGVQPALGRAFGAEEAVPVNENGVPKNDAVIVLSHSGRQTFFGGDPAVLGRTIELSDRHFTVIGVMPPDFRFPNGGTQFWFPSEIERLPAGWMGGPNTQVFARLNPGVTTQQTEALLETVAQRLMTDHAKKKGYIDDWRRRPDGLGFWVRPARQQFTDGRNDLQRTLFGLLGAIGFVLLIVCANIANLSLARTEKRQQELAVRTALGAGRFRLMRLLLTESVLLSCVGGLFGLAISYWGIRLMTALVPEFMPRMRPIHIDGYALAFTLATSVLTGLIFGCAPAWQTGRRELGEALKQAGSKATASRAQRRFRGALVVTELALTLVLLTGAGLLIESMRRLLHVDPGFDPENVLLVSVDLPWERYNDQENHERAIQLRKVLFSQVHERLAGLPVKAVGIGKHGAWPEKLKVEGRDEEVELLQDGCGVGPNDLFRAMRIPLRSGRYFDTQDVGEGGDTAIINETMARTLWPGEEAVGKKFGGRVRGGVRQYQVVGVVGDFRDYKYDQQVRPTFYRPCHELGLEGLRPFFAVRTEIDPRAVVAGIQKELKTAEPDMRKPQIAVCRDVLHDSTQARRTYMRYLTVFAGVGLFLSALGIYGVLAFSVVKRTQEIGIRMALGAERRQVLSMILADGARLIAIGAVAGLMAAFWLMRLVRHQLFDVRPTEPLVFVGSALLLATIALLACLVPARRAARVDPVEALRHE
jgi:putative ABC transport system permease protein